MGCTNCKKNNKQPTTEVDGKQIVEACVPCEYRYKEICRVHMACTCSMLLCPKNKWPETK